MNKLERDLVLRKVNFYKLKHFSIFGLFFKLNFQETYRTNFILVSEN